MTDATNASAAKRREPLHRRTFQPVHKGSRRAGGERCRGISWQERDLRLAAFDKEALAAKKAGKRWGAEGSYSRIDRGVLAELLRLAVVCGGFVVPSRSGIAEAVRCTVRSVDVSLTRLKRGGWLSWDRRYIETGETGVRGPQVHQTSNFYYLKVPTAAGVLMEQWKARRAAKEPDDLAVDRQRRQSFMDKCRALDEATAKSSWADRSPAIAKADAKAAADLARSAAANSS